MISIERPFQLRFPAPEVLFMVAAVSQYLGAALAVELFSVLAPAGTALLRVGSAALMMTIIMALRVFRGQFSGGYISRKDLRQACLFGVILAGMNTSIYFSIAELPLGNAVAVEFLGPLSVTAAGTRNKRSAGALALAATGVAILAGVEASGTLRGVGFAVLAGSFWAGYILLGHKIAHSRFAREELGIGLLVGALAISPIGLDDVMSTLDSPKVLALGCVLGLLSNVIPYRIEQLIMSRISHTRFASLQALLPVTATIIGFLLLLQIPSPRELIGIGLVVTAIALGRNDL